MKLYLMGHTFRYALEQIQMSLFPEEKMEYTEQPFSEGDGTVSALHIGPCYTTAVTTITYHGRAVRARPAAGDRLGCLRLSAVSFCSSATIWPPGSICLNRLPGAPFPACGPAKLPPGICCPGGTSCLCRPTIAG